MTPEEMLARLLYRDGLMLVIDKPAGFAVHRGPKGGEAWRTISTRCASACRAAGAGAPARPRHLRLPGARPPPQGAGPARQAVQAGQGRQDLLGGGRRRTRADEGRIEIAARPSATRARGWWMKARPARPALGDGLEGDGALRPPPCGEGRGWRSKLRQRHDLAALEPLTGRTHQLRVHCAEMGFPIVGDTIYGTRAAQGRARRCICMRARSRCRSPRTSRR